MANTTFLPVPGNQFRAVNREPCTHVIWIGVLKANLLSGFGGVLVCADKIERAGQAEQQILSGKAVSGEVTKNATLFIDVQSIQFDLVMIKFTNLC